MNQCKGLFWFFQQLYKVNANRNTEHSVLERRFLFCFVLWDEQSKYRHITRGKLLSGWDRVNVAKWYRALESGDGQAWLCFSHGLFVHCGGAGGSTQCLCVTRVLKQPPLQTLPCLLPGIQCCELRGNLLAPVHVLLIRSNYMAQSRRQRLQEAPFVLCIWNKPDVFVGYK